MTLDVAGTQTRTDIRAKILAIAKRNGRDASRLADDDVIPESGTLDSAGIMELLVWYEERFNLTLDPADITVENLGSIDAMTAYAQRHGRSD